MEAKVRVETDRNAPESRLWSPIIGASEAKRWQRRGGGAPRQTKKREKTTRRDGEVANAAACGKPLIRGFESLSRLQYHALAGPARRSRAPTLRRARAAGVFRWWWGPTPTTCQPSLRSRRWLEATAHCGCGSVRVGARGSATLTCGSRRQRCIPVTQQEIRVGMAIRLMSSRPVVRRRSSSTLAVAFVFLARPSPSAASAVSSTRDQRLQPVPTGTAVPDGTRGRGPAA